jgi:oxygen-independent coproporphyrinogen-3 oxidase
MQTAATHIAAGSPIGLYVHIPFCETKCPYCDFNTYSGIEPLMPAYVDALATEMEIWGAMLGRPATGTVFFGGGTPSYLPAESLNRLMQTYSGAFEVAPLAETTIEANPGDITAEKLGSWLSSGVNRLSIGVQSFDDGLLRLLGRRHNAAQAEGAARLARSSGFRNLSLDLMFGLPRQTPGQWQASVERAVEIAPEHLSLYGLQLEHGTPLEAAVRTGAMPAPDDDLAADMYDAARDTLERAGYVHYEISNWARPGRESVHNLAYWKCQPYLGVGPGAHSSLGGRRFANMKSPKSYMAAVEAAAMASERRRPASAEVAGAVDFMRTSGPVDFLEEISPATAAAETMMMGLRLRDGVADSEFRERHGAGLNERYPRVIEELVASGLVESDEIGVRLTRRGKLLGNEVFRRFVAAQAQGG